LREYGHEKEGKEIPRQHHRCSIDHAANSKIARRTSMRIADAEIGLGKTRGQGNVSHG
jgi:hypothetical protein